MTKSKESTKTMYKIEITSPQGIEEYGLALANLLANWAVIAGLPVEHLLILLHDKGIIHGYSLMPLYYIDNKWAINVIIQITKALKYYSISVNKDTDRVKVVIREHTQGWKNKPFWHNDLGQL